VKLALLGDIHGNYRALTAVLVAAASSGVEKLLITGDLVGYYEEPLMVLNLLQAWDCHLVRGNHEDMLRIARTDANFLAKMDVRYGRGLRMAIQQLSKKQLDELCNLPHPLKLNVDDCEILLCHGSPWDNNQYVYPDAEPELLDRCALQEYDLIVLGHTHYPMSRLIGKTLVVNPGSVGQQRNRQPGAHWALFDTSNHSLTFYNEAYDTSALVQECKQKQPGLSYLADVLERR
jgi:putative phosphoesterase